jgi:hypothetical protein
MIINLKVEEHIYNFFFFFKIFLYFLEIHCLIVKITHCKLIPSHIFYPTCWKTSAICLFCLSLIDISSARLTSKWWADNGYIVRISIIVGRIAFRSKIPGVIFHTLSVCHCVFGNWNMWSTHGQAFFPKINKEKTTN